MGAPIANLRGPLHVTAVELYRGHHGDAAGACVRCGYPVPCLVRRHAASVIVAAGDDPRGYDGGSLRPGAGGGSSSGAPQTAAPVGSTVDHSGYALAGRRIAMDPEALLYERAR